MTIIKILQYPDKRLKRIGVRVENFDETIQKVIDDMFETRYATSHCAALAATQLDLEIPWCITVIDLSKDNNEPLCLVNPEITQLDGEQIEYEGCMSVYPDLIHEKVKRAMRIQVKAQDRHGQPLDFSAEGYLAKCIQHEVDHLNGGLYLDRLPQFKLERIAKKVKKQERLQKKPAEG
jgi:peptide deformylase